MIMTVLGPVDPDQLGFTLPHEHIMVDFAGAATAGPHRYDRDEVVRTMEPHLRSAADAGVRSFVDCSPMYLARDPVVLRELARRTGVHIVTNTGQYKEPYLPEETFALSADALADQWIAEWTDGIESTDVRPGFIKTAVNPVPLAETQQKIITAAALTSIATGMTIGTHTCRGVPALQILKLLDHHGVAPGKWIFIHAHQESDIGLLKLVARSGCWIELDGIGAATDESILSSLLQLLDAGFESQIMLSHDAGWYSVGEPGGGDVKPYTYLSTRFIPLLRDFGLSQASIHALTVTNPARAFTIDPV
ncbi:MAG: phosphotriesterase [Spirochaetaceae bacterium]|nr:MAG: phosphotriesterase [Spirochaetaceae bacterium]